MEEPKKLNSEDIKKLFGARLKAPAVTIYLPTHHSSSPTHMSEDQIRLKNLRNQAAAIIKTSDDQRDFEQEFCDSLGSLSDYPGFWEKQTNGLLICARPGSLRMFHLPLDTEEYVSVSDQFHLAPVFGLLNDFKEYYVLAVAQHSPSLFKGDMYGLYPTNVDLPNSMMDGLNIDEMSQENERPRSAYRANPQSGVSGYNGRGGDKNPAEEERQRFWRMIDQQVISMVKDKLPLILAGIESEVAEYIHQTHYPNVMKGHIEGSFSGVNPHDLFADAIAIVRNELINPEHDQIIEQYDRTAGQAPDKVAAGYASISQLAAEGRVDKLLLAGIRLTMDTIRDNKEPVPVICFPPTESAQAINNVARVVVEASGSIVNIETSHMPVKNMPVLAILRY